MLRLTGLLIVVLTWLAAPALADESSYYWKWSDGSKATSRSFSETTFDSPKALPRLVVTSTPPAAGMLVRLEFQQAGAWRVESTAQTNANGIAALIVNPLCESRRWCDETIRYRLRIDGQTAPLTVTYRALLQADANAFS